MHKQEFVLLSLLTVLNIILRIPSVPHEIGNDSFQIHALANSISQFGVANWWVNEYSIFGLYSYSYASAMPFLLSGISQLTNIDMEITVWVMCLVIGLFGMLSTYLMAGAIYDKVYFKILMAFFFSASQGILQFTVWDASARGLFLVFFPLFFYLILTTKYPVIKKLSLIFLVFVLLRSTHNFSYFTIPIILAYLTTTRFFNAKSLQNIHLKFSDYYSLIFVIALFGMAMVPFLTRIFISGSRYDAIFELIITTTRYAGPLVFFTISGLVFLVFKKQKTNVEWFFLATMLGFVPMFYSEIYGKFILLIFIVLFISIAFKNMVEVSTTHKLMTIAVIVLLLSFITFSSFYNHYRTGPSKDYWYMDEETNVAGIWTRNYMEENTHVFTTGGEILRLLAISNGHAVFPTLPPTALTYGFVTVSEVMENTIQNEVLSLDYYFDGPYVQRSGTSMWGSYSWLSDFNIDNKRVDVFTDRYDIKFTIIDMKHSYKPILISIDDSKNRVYDNERIRVWSM